MRAGPRRTAVMNTAIIGSQIHGSTNNASPRQRDQRVQRPEPKPRGARALECERGPAMLRVPRQHGREHQQGHRQCEPGFGCRQPMPVLAARQQVDRRSAEGQHRRVFGEQRKPGTKARCQPPAQIASLERAQQAQRRRQQRAVERAVRQHPGPGRHAEHRRQVQQYRRPEPARASAIAAPSRYISQVDSANSAMNGRRTTIAASLPNRCAAPQLSHHAAGGWSK